MRRVANIFDRHVGANIKRLRLGRKQTQRRIAEVLGISYQSYQSLEAGGVTFTGQTLVKLSEYYQVSIDDLLSGTIPVLNNALKIAHLSALIATMTHEQATEAMRAVQIIKDS